MFLINIIIMKIIRTKIHGIIDYFIGVAIMGSPWLFGYHTGGPEMIVPLVLGGLFIINSLLTNYECGAAKLIPMSSHLLADGLMGSLLAFSPWIFGFESLVYIPHLLFGLGIIALVVLSSNTPYLYLYYVGNHSSYSIRNII